MAKRERFFAGFGAALFLITSSTLTVLAIVTLTSSNSNQVQNSTNSSSNTASNNSTQKSNSSIASLPFKQGAVLPSQVYKPQSQPITSLQYADVVKGTGAVVTASDSIKADYVGFLANSGKVFDDSAIHGGAITFPLNGVIAGWSEGIPGMRVGGVRELLIPSSLAYGKQGTTGIPPNSDLGFFVQVDAIAK